jgi:hypothetical protein
MAVDICITNDSASTGLARFEGCDVSGFESGGADEGDDGNEGTEDLHDVEVLFDV